jgi:glycosyltransferase involved in cell wall biosynthesis
MEAMACGCCVIASDTGGNPELVRDRQTGILFPPGDVQALALALRLLIGETTRRLRLAEAGERFIRSRFAADASAARMADIYMGLLTR